MFVFCGQLCTLFNRGSLDVNDEAIIELPSSKWLYC
jgi:hypothetical protein